MLYREVKFWVISESAKDTKKPLAHSRGIFFKINLMQNQFKQIVTILKLNFLTKIYMHNQNFFIGFCFLDI